MKVTTQAEMDQAIADGERIILCGGGPFCFSGSAPRVECTGSSAPRVECYDSSAPRVVCYGSSAPRVVCSDSSAPRVVCTGSSAARVECYDSSAPRVVCYGSSAPRVECYDSSAPRVECYGSTSLSATGGVVVVASACVTVNCDGACKVTGGVVARKPAVITAQQWCDYWGVSTNGGQVVLYKAVDGDYISSRSFAYRPGTTPVAPDWDGGKAECGGGLHFCASPVLAAQYHCNAVRYIACPIKLSDIVVHPNAQHPSKIKAKGCCAPVWEVDISGDPAEGGALCTPS